MNYLAHLFLSGEDTDLLIGNFIADFVSNKDLKTIDKSIQRGIFLHRAIDEYTDRHPSIRKGNKRLHARHRKYAGVINDIFCDHLLYLRWQDYTEESFNDFEKRVYGVLLSNIEQIPIRKQYQVRSMIAHKWLKQYKSLDGINDVFKRMQHRVPEDANLNLASQTLSDHLPDFQADFDIFFPECLDFVEYKLKLINLQNES